MHSVRFYCTSQCYHNKIGCNQAMLANFTGYAYIYMNLYYINIGSDEGLSLTDYYSYQLLREIFYNFFFDYYLQQNILNHPALHINHLVVNLPSTIPVY